MHNLDEFSKAIKEIEGLPRNVVIHWSDFNKEVWKREWRYDLKKLVSSSLERNDIYISKECDICEKSVIELINTGNDLQWVNVCNSCIGTDRINIEDNFRKKYLAKDENKNSCITGMSYDFEGCSDIVLNELSAMIYKDFLETTYWKVISEWKKEQFDYKCQLCNSSKNLNTHHRSYKKRGYEFHDSSDLTVLCKKCHSKFHNKGK